jgi:hypothetical protein
VCAGTGAHDRRLDGKLRQDARSGAFVHVHLDHVAGVNARIQMLQAV